MFLLPSLTFAACRSALQVALELREGALDQVSKNERSTQSKVWLAHVEEVDFSRAVSVLTRFEKLALASNGADASPLLKNLIADKIGRNVLSAVSGEDVDAYLGRNGEKGLGSFVLNGVLFRFFYLEEHVDLKKTVALFNSRVEELSGFLSRFEKELAAESEHNAKTKAHYERYAYFLSEGQFIKSEQERRAPHVYFQNLLRHYREMSESAAGSPVEPYRNLNLMIDGYRDLERPPLLRGHYLDALWDFVSQKRREQFFSFYEAELFHVLSALVHAEADAKESYAMDFFLSLESFDSVFLKKIDAERAHVFKLGLLYQMPRVLNALSTGGEGRVVIDGAYVSPSAFDIIRKWCAILELREPLYEP
ncbi:MAG: hypothetical protein R3A80_13840 [Bdellovibrionota bacterium]